MPTDIRNSNNAELVEFLQKLGKALSEKPGVAPEVGNWTVSESDDKHLALMTRVIFSGKPPHASAIEVTVSISWTPTTFFFQFGFGLAHGAETEHLCSHHGLPRGAGFSRALKYGVEKDSTGTLESILKSYPDAHKAVESRLAELCAKIYHPQSPAGTGSATDDRAEQNTREYQQESAILACQARIENGAELKEAFDWLREELTEIDKGTVIYQE